MSTALAEKPVETKSEAEVKSGLEVTIPGQAAEFVLIRLRKSTSKDPDVVALQQRFANRVKLNKVTLNKAEWLVLAPHIQAYLRDRSAFILDPEKCPANKCASETFVYKKVVSNVLPAHSKYKIKVVPDDLRDAPKRPKAARKPRKSANKK